MRIEKPASAGTLESSDIMITISPGSGAGVEVTLESPVKSIYGEDIVNVIKSVLDKFDVKDAKVFAKDSGAHNPVITARVETAIRRSIGGKMR